MINRLLIILPLLLSISSTAQNKKSLLRTGNDLYTDSSYNQAEIQYRKSLEKDQDYFNASFNLADAVYKQERYSESSGLFDALKDNAPTNEDLTKIYHNLGNSLFKEQKLDDAIESYKSALRINPDDDDTRYNLALAKQQKQQQEENKEEQEEEKQEEKEEQEQENQEEKKENKQEEKKENQQEGGKEDKEEMSKEDAEKMLEAIQQQEKELQEELQKKKVKGKKVKVLKDW